MRLLRPVDKKDPKKGTLGQHCWSVVQQSNGKTVPAPLADRLEDPEAIMYLWDWYWQLARSRRYRPDGRPEGIGYQDLWYWQLMFNVKPRDWELDMLFRMDKVFLGVLAGEEE